MQACYSSHMKISHVTFFKKISIPIPLISPFQMNDVRALLATVTWTSNV